MGEKLWAAFCWMVVVAFVIAALPIVVLDLLVTGYRREFGDTTRT